MTKPGHRIHISTVLSKWTRATQSFKLTPVFRTHDNEMAGRMPFSSSSPPPLETFGSPVQPPRPPIVSEPLGIPCLLPKARACLCAASFLHYVRSYIYHSKKCKRIGSNIRPVMPIGLQPTDAVSRLRKGGFLFRIPVSLGFGMSGNDVRRTCLSAIPITR